MDPQAGMMYIYEHVYSDWLGMVLERLGALRLEIFRKAVEGRVVTKGDLDIFKHALKVCLFHPCLICFCLLFYNCSILCSLLSILKQHIIYIHHMRQRICEHGLDA